MTRGGTKEECHVTKSNFFFFFFFFVFLHVRTLPKRICWVGHLRKPVIWIHSISRYSNVIRPHKFKTQIIYWFKSAPRWMGGGLEPRGLNNHHNFKFGYGLRLDPYLSEIEMWTWGLYIQLTDLEFILSTKRHEPNNVSYQYKICLHLSVFLKIKDRGPIIVI